MNIAGYISESINEGTGFRAVVFIAGCKHACKGCYSVNTWSFNSGKPFVTDLQLEIIEDIKNNPLLSGITLCGGDPFYSSQDVVEFLNLLESKNGKINTWCYTGFTFEQIVKDKKMSMLLDKIDVLVDGKFDINKRDLSLPFRGSSNQRIIDVKQSLLEGKVVEVNLNI